MLSYTAAAVSAAEATAYLSAGGATGWPVVAGDQEAAIIRGQRYIASRYNARWVDEWTTAPDAVKYAISEAALIEAKTPGSLSITSTPAADKVLVEVKGIRWERIGGSSGADGWLPRVSIIEGLLIGLVRPDNGTLYLERA